MGFQIHRRMLFAGQKAYHHQGDAAGDGAGHGGAETEGHTCQLPAHADHEACHHAHEEHQEDGQAVDEGAQEHTLFGGLPIPGGEGPLPHLRTGHGEHQLGDDVVGNTAVEVGLDQLRVQVGHKAREPDHSLEGSDGDKNIHEDQQHIELQHVRVDHAEQA